MLFARGIEGVLSQWKRWLMLNMIYGGASRQHTSFRLHWNQHNYNRWVTIQPNTVQNGLLLDSTIHALFDGYEITINPDARIPYFFQIITGLLVWLVQHPRQKIVCFRQDTLPVTISTSNCFRIRFDHLITCCGGTPAKQSLLV